MRVAVVTMVQYYLGYRYIVGKVVHGYCACVWCMDDTTYKKLEKDPRSLKIVFMGHRRWLDKDDPWRKHKELFDGEVELQRAPHTRSGEEINKMLKNWKECPTPGYKRKVLTPLMKVWKTRSIFWDLPYWKILHTPHSLDVMHITKTRVRVFLALYLTCRRGPKMGLNQEAT
jgi:hypothetical protein